MFGVRKINLKKIIDQKKKTMYAVAKDTGISYTTIHKLCTKPVASIDLEVLDKLTKYLDSSPTEILAIEK